MKTHIDISNYEEYVIDYLDGQLSDADQEAFLNFLALNPEIAAEVEELSAGPVLVPEGNMKMDRDALKISVQPVGRLDEENYESYFSAAADEALTHDEEEELNVFLTNNPKLTPTFNLYQRTVLKADQSIVFPDKGGLKRSIPLWSQVRPTALRVAAALVLLLAGYTVTNTLVNTTDYLPRSSEFDYTTITIPKGPSDSDALEDSNPIDRQLEKEPVVLASAEPIERRQTQSIASLNRLPLERIAVDASHSLPQRELAAYKPSVPKGLEQQANEALYASNNSGVMNLNQFVAKNVLGLDPDKTETTTALIREGLLQAINEQERINVHASETNNKGKTLEFFAGNFGFKRVSYEQ